MAGCSQVIIKHFDELEVKLTLMGGDDTLPKIEVKGNIYKVIYITITTIVFIGGLVIKQCIQYC